MNIPVDDPLATKKFLMEELKHTYQYGVQAGMRLAYCNANAGDTAKDVNATFKMNEMLEGQTELRLQFFLDHILRAERSLKKE